jgi:hypothetical protein
MRGHMLHGLDDEMDLCDQISVKQANGGGITIVLGFS